MKIGEAIIFFILFIVFVFAGITATNGALLCYFMGALVFWCALDSLKHSKKGREK